MSESTNIPQTESSIAAARVAHLAAARVVLNVSQSAWMRASGLSKRAAQALIDIGVKTVADLVARGWSGSNGIEAALKNLRGAGPKVISEIKTWIGH